MKALTNEEYEGMLREKVLRVEAQTAVIDEEIGRLREEARRGLSANTKKSLTKD